jgi:hypothetical protein
VIRNDEHIGIGELRQYLTILQTHAITHIQANEAEKPHSSVHDTFYQYRIPEYIFAKWIHRSFEDAEFR